MPDSYFISVMVAIVLLSGWRRWRLRTVVSGVVVDSSSGRPLPGLRVELHPSRGPEPFAVVPTDSPLQVVVSDARGAFRFEAVQAGGQYLLATRAGPGMVAGGGYLRLGRWGSRSKLRLGHVPRV